MRASSSPTRVTAWASATAMPRTCASPTRFQSKGGETIARTNRGGRDRRGNSVNWAGTRPLRELGHASLTPPPSPSSPHRRRRRHHASATKTTTAKRIPAALRRGWTTVATAPAPPAVRRSTASASASSGATAACATRALLVVSVATTIGSARRPMRPLPRMRPPRRMRPLRRRRPLRRTRISKARLCAWTRAAATPVMAFVTTAGRVPSTKRFATLERTARTADRAS